jgi:hypothetical protein
MHSGKVLSLENFFVVDICENKSHINIKIKVINIPGDVFYLK